MKNDLIGDNLSRRQRQLLEVLYEMGEASAEEIRARIPNAPSNSAIRATLKIMEDRVLVVRRERGLHYVYSASMERKVAQKSAIQRLLRLFFNNSTEQAMVALLGVSKKRLSPEQLKRVRDLIERAERKC